MEVKNKLNFGAMIINAVCSAVWIPLSIYFIVCCVDGFQVFAETLEMFIYYLIVLVACAIILSISVLNFFFSVSTAEKIVRKNQDKLELNKFVVAINVFNIILLTMLSVWFFFSLRVSVMKLECLPYVIAASPLILSETLSYLSRKGKTTLNGENDG